MAASETVIGLVIEALPNTQFIVQLKDATEKRCYIGGRMKRNRIRVMVGDHVEYVPDHQGESNRIIKRLSGKSVLR